jgi:hypothetical protein
MHLQIQPSVDAVSIHPSVLPPPEIESPPAPRTAAASRMRLKHGLHSLHAVVPGESREAFRAFRNDLIQDLRPVDAEECALAEQMVVAQWRLKRLWATQTGVYELFEQICPAEAGETHPLRLADCFSDDCANERELDKLSLHEVRLVNIFHRCGRRLDLLRDQRRKRFSRPESGPFAEEEVLYATPPPAAPASEPLAVPQPPAPPPVVVHAETAATPSNDATSSENADRGGGAADAANIHIENTPADTGDRPDVGADRDPPPHNPPPRDPPPRDWRAAIDGRGVNQ